MYQLKNVIFHSYVSLPEGRSKTSSGNHVEAQDWLEWMLPNFQLYLEGVSFGSSTRVTQLQGSGV